MKFASHLVTLSLDKNLRRHQMFYEISYGHLCEFVEHRQQARITVVDHRQVTGLR